MPTTKKTINPDLEKERQKCTFDVEEFARYWIGDQTKLDEKRARGWFTFNLNNSLDFELAQSMVVSEIMHSCVAIF